MGLLSSRGKISARQSKQPQLHVWVHYVCDCQIVEQGKEEEQEKGGGKVKGVKMQIKDKEEVTQ